MSLPRAVSALLLVLACALGAGCVSKPPKARLPYAWPESTQIAATAAADRPTALITQIEDRREDRVLEAFLEEPMPETVKRILAAELTHAGVFSRVESRPASGLALADVELGLVLEDVSWAVPNYERMVQTAFWTSFLTGGLGGVAYGSTDTPVYGRAAFSLTATRPATREVLFEKRVEALHEEKMAKFSSDTLDTRLRMSATALKKAMEQLRAEMSAQAPAFSAPPAPAAAPSAPLASAPALPAASAP